MKKATVVAVVIAAVMAWGAAYAADDGEIGSIVRPQNGISYLSLGPAAGCNEPVERMESVAQSMPFNGVTVFSLGEPGSGAKGSCANKAEKRISSSKPYNAVTVF